MNDEPRIDVLPARSTQTTAVVLVLHGGRQHGFGSVHPLRLAYLRMRPFANAIHTAAADKGVAVWLLRYRYRGWNEPREDPVQDARWALRRIHEEHPGVPVALVGHSMGGRVAFRVADEPDVTAVCALAPWTERDEPVEGITGKTVLIAHGDQERMTDPALSYDFAVRAKSLAGQIARFNVHGDGHAMLRRAADWTALVRDFTVAALGFEPMPDVITNAFRAPSPDGLSVPLAEGTR